MAKAKTPGPFINGETANAWEGRTRRQLLTPREKGGYGLSEKEVAGIEKQLAGIRPPRSLRPDPPALTILDKVQALDFTDGPDKPKEVELDTLPPGKVDSGYFVMFIVEGGYEPAQFIAVELPPGLSLNVHGVLSGVFVQAGDQTVKVKVVDGMGDETEKAFTVSVADNPQAETEAEGEEESEEESARHNRPGLASFITPSVVASVAPPVVEAAETPETPVEPTGQNGEGTQGAGAQNANTGNVGAATGQPAGEAATQTSETPKEGGEATPQTPTDAQTPGKKAGKTGDKTNGGS